MVGCGVVVAYAPRCASFYSSGLACEAIGLKHIFPYQLSSLVAPIYQ